MYNAVERHSLLEGSYQPHFKKFVGIFKSDEGISNPIEQTTPLMTSSGNENFLQQLEMFYN